MIRLLRLIPLLVGAVALATYLCTLTPGVDFIDSGELAAAAGTLGISHPTGYPLFTLIGFFFSRLPIAASTIARLNLMNVFFAAAGAALFTIFAKALLDGARGPEFPGPGGGKKKKDKRRTSTHAEQVSRSADNSAGNTAIAETISWLAAAAAGLLLVWSATYWEAGTTLEVYSLHAAFVSLLLYLALRYALEKERTRAIRLLAGFFLALGFSLANHLTTPLLLPGCLVLFWGARKENNIRLRTVATLSLLVIPGLLLYLYLPLRAARHPPVVWGEPTTLKSLWNFLTVADFRGRLLTRQIDGEPLWKFLLRLPRRTGFVSFPLIAAGFPLLYRRSRRLFFFLLLATVLPALYAATYNVPDNLFYFNPAVMGLTAFAAVGYRWLFSLAWKPTRSRAVILAGVALLTLPALLTNYSAVNKRNNYFVEDFVRNLFSAIEPDAILFALDNHVILHPLYYYQNLENFRPDVVVLSNHGLQKGWFGRQLKWLHPEIYRESQREIEDYRNYLEKFEAGAARDRRLLDEKYYHMLGSIIDHNFDRRPIYITSEFDPEQHPAFHPGYQRIPEGLAWRLYRRDQTPKDFPYREFPYRDLPYPHKDADAARHAYLYMLKERAIYEITRGNYDLALRWIDQAVRVWPGEKLLSDSHNGKWVVPNRYREVLALRDKVLALRKAREGKP